MCLVVLMQHLCVDSLNDQKATCFFNSVSDSGSYDKSAE